MKALVFPFYSLQHNEENGNIFWLFILFFLFSSPLQILQSILDAASLSLSISLSIWPTFFLKQRFFKSYLQQVKRSVTLVFMSFCFLKILSCLQGMKELKRLVESLPPVNYNLLKYICRYWVIVKLDKIQTAANH